MKPPTVAGYRIGRHSRLLALIAAAVLPILIFAAGAVYLIDRQHREAIEESIRTTVRTSSVALDQELAGRLSELGILAQTLRLDHSDEAPLRSLLQLHKDWLSLTLVDAQTSRPTLHLSRSPDAAAILPALAADDIRRAVGEGRSVISGVEARQSSDAEPAIALTAPVVRNGSIRYLLTLRLEAKALSDVLISQGFDSTWTVGGLDQNRMIAARNRAHEQFVGRRATPTLVEQIDHATTDFFIALNQEGQRVYTAFQTTPYAGWTAVVGVPSEVIEQPLQRSRQFIALTGGGALLVTALLSAGLIRSQARRQSAEERIRTLEAEWIVEQRLSDVAAHLPGVIYRQVLHQDGRTSFPFMSAGAFELLGVEPNHISEPMPIEQAEAFFHVDDRRLWHDSVMSSASTLSPLTVDVRLPGSSSSQRWIRILAQANRNKEGETNWDGVLLDLTEHKERERSPRHRKWRRSASSPVALRTISITS